MSRAYRVQVRESLRHVVRASDHVSTQLELLDILPAEAMADLLRGELEGRGFRREGPALVRRDGGVTITVEPETGTVTVQAESEQQVRLEAERVGSVYDDWGGEQRKKSEAALRERLGQEMREDFQRQAEQKTAELQQQVTDQLEGRLIDLRAELDQAVNRVTAEALKRKAAQIGQIKEMTEDPQSGSLTIVLEV
jgi:hypothetical protein